jgi:hypothetical protein
MGFGRRNAISGGTGAYETWVTAIRRWSVDQTVPLDGLPALSETDYDRASFERFTVHLVSAIEVFMAGWNLQLTQAFSRADTEHDLAVELVRLRNLLRPRLELSEHPGLPEGIRAALAKGLAADLTGMQAQLEEGVRHSSSRGSVDTRRTDALLRVVRENSLLSLLRTAARPDVPTDDTVSTPPAMRRGILTHQTPFDN